MLSFVVEFQLHDVRLMAHANFAEVWGHMSDIDPDITYVNYEGWRERWLGEQHCRNRSRSTHRFVLQATSVATFRDQLRYIVSQLPRYSRADLFTWRHVPKQLGYCRISDFSDINIEYLFKGEEPSNAQ